jgi:hypothetical protein
VLQALVSLLDVASMSATTYVHLRFLWASSGDVIPQLSTTVLLDKEAEADVVELLLVG